MSKSYIQIHLRTIINNAKNKIHTCEYIIFVTDEENINYNV